jgi:hypothetical protein
MPRVVSTNIHNMGDTSMQTRKRPLIGSIAILTLLVTFAAVASAHHGRAGYTKEASSIKGTVTSLEWKNPHVFVNFDVKDDSGNVVHWTGELSSPGTMLAAGMSRTSLKPGDEIEVKGKTGQDGVAAVLIDSIMKNGKMLVGGRDGEKFTSDTR